MMVLLSVLHEMGLGIEAAATRVAVGGLETESMTNRLFMVAKTGEVFVIITVLPYKLDQSIIIILFLNILHLPAPSFFLQILIFCVPAQIRCKLDCVALKPLRACRKWI
jgi:hypothetical protein